MYTTSCAETEICPRSSKNQAPCPNHFVAMELSKIIQSKVERLPAAIESWKASFFVRNICTDAGWLESVAIWMCKLPAAIQAEAEEFELLLISHALVCRPSASARAYS